MSIIFILRIHAHWKILCIGTLLKMRKTIIAVVTGAVISLREASNTC